MHSEFFGLKIPNQSNFNPKATILRPNSGFLFQSRPTKSIASLGPTLEGYLCEKHKVKDCVEAQKILDDLVSFYNDQRIHEETREIPTKRWQQAIHQGKGKLRPLEPPVDLERVFSIHLKRKVRKDGSIMFMGKKWSIGYPEGTPVTLCLIPNVKFMVCREDKKLWEVHL